MNKTIKGNKNLLYDKKCTFLSSKKYTASLSVNSFEWAENMRYSSKCITSGFQSPIEKDVLNYLLKGTCPVIMVLARGMLKKIDKNLVRHIDSGRLLIVSIFPESVKRITSETSFIRNKYIIDVADEIVVGYADPQGKLIQLLQNTDKKITYLSN